MTDALKTALDTIAKPGFGKPKQRLGCCPEGMCIDEASIVAAERERCAKLVPTNWCDPLLTGKDAPKLPLDASAVETLLRGIQDRIRGS